MAVRNWEQEQVRQELHNIKTASKRSNLLRLRDPGKSNWLMCATPKFHNADRETSNNILISA